MQTKNVNISQAPLNNSIQEKNQQVTNEGSQTVSENSIGLSSVSAPPLPPRGLPTSSAPPQHLASRAVQQQAEVEGYGPYKPVPPPKPLSTYSPPPYRMPPYPLYGDTAIPGAAATEPGTSGLHTHSSKFPIEREVILSSADKNSKIPILHEYKKQRPKSSSAATIAPEGPSKQVAWTEDKKGHMMQIQDGHRGAKPSLPQDYRSPYHGVNGVTEGPYHYNGQHGGSSTGAVPRTWAANGRMDDGQDNCRVRTQAQQFQSQSMAGRSPASLPHHNGQPSNAENAKIAPEYKSGDASQDPERGNGELGKDGSKEGDKNKAFPTRTYHTIKDMISSRFGSAKVPKEGEAYSASMGEQGTKSGENSQNGAAALNNIPSVGSEGSPRKNSHNSRMVPKEDDLELSQRQQHMLGGGPQQTLASSRREGVYQSPHAATRRMGEGGSENARGHCDQQSVYVPPQEHQGRIPAEYPSGREYAPQQQENLYNYGSQRPKPQNQRFANQQGVLEQNGIYMVMRQGTSSNPQQGYQHAVPASTSSGNYQSGHYGNKESQFEQGQQKTEPQPSGDIRRQNIVGVLEGRGFSTHDVSRQVAESSNYGTTNTPGAKRSEPQSSGNQSRRGSVPQLDEDDDEGGFVMGIGRGSAGAKSLRSSNHSRGGDNFPNAPHPQSSGQSSDYEKATQRSTGQSSSNADSGRGSTIYSGGHQASQGGLTPERLDTSTESSDSPQVAGNRRDAMYGLPSNLATANDSEWVDIVESELRQILDPKMHGLGHPVVPAGTNSTLSESISSLTPPLPPLSPGGGSSPSMSPQNSRYKHGSRKASQSAGVGTNKSLHGRGNSGSANTRTGWSTRGGNKNQLNSEKQHRQSSKKSEQLLSTSTKGNKIPLSASVFGLDTTDLTSTTTGLDSMLEGNTENNSSDDDLSTTIDATDAHTIRKQLEGLENMYSEVLKLLGVKKYGGRYQPSDPRINKRRLYGSMSSLPSSVSSRPMRDKRRQDDRKKVKDIKGINKRFQRLESHVVTLARSVAHLSSEMRTQHLMIQEMENIRGEISALRSQTLAVRSQSMPRGLNNLLASADRDTALPALTNPTRVKKLTKFFGDEPPLLRLFLKKLGYEKYAGTFEQERVGMVELPYLTEERLQKMGIPLGPRLRILQEAQISVCRDKVYVV